MINYDDLDLKYIKNVKEKMNLLHWKWLLSKALSLQSIQEGGEYLLALITTKEVIGEVVASIMKNALFPTRSVDLVNIKVIRKLTEDNSLNIYHLSDSSDVIVQSECSYKQDWILCDRDLNVSKSSHINTIYKVIKSCKTITSKINNPQITVSGVIV